MNRLCNDDTVAEVAGAGGGYENEVAVSSDEDDEDDEDDEYGDVEVADAAGTSENEDSTCEDFRSVQFIQENPKGAGSESWKRYEIYKHATTMDKYIKLNPDKALADLKNNTKKGFMKIM